MKIFFIATSVATIYLIYTKFKATYDGNHDTFRMEFLLLPCTVLALVVNHQFTVMEVRNSAILLLFYSHTSCAVSFIITDGACLFSPPIAVNSYLTSVIIMS